MNKAVLMLVLIAVAFGVAYLLSTTCATPEYKGSTEINSLECLVTPRWKIYLFELTGYKFN